VGSTWLPSVCTAQSSARRCPRPWGDPRHQETALQAGQGLRSAGVCGEHLQSAAPTFGGRLPAALRDPGRPPSPHCSVPSPAHSQLRAVPTILDVAPRDRDCHIAAPRVTSRWLHQVLPALPMPALAGDQLPRTPCCPVPGEPDGTQISTVSARPAPCPAESRFCVPLAARKGEPTASGTAAG